MQTLYSLSTLHLKNDIDTTNADKMLDSKLDDILNLFIVAISYVLQISKFVETDAIQRTGKYLITAEDLNIDTKIANNTLVTKILANEAYNNAVKNPSVKKYLDNTQIKQLYQQLINTEEYKNYIKTKEYNKIQDKAILQFIWEKIMLENETLLSYFTDELPAWEDDFEQIKILMQNFFGASSKIEYNSLLSSEKRVYAHELLHAVLEKEDYLMTIITPRLKNWDKERVAIIDMILLKMGVSEFLYFPTIPTKVTINEYIDIAKMYSTPQSGHFVNGVLDNILKDFTLEGIIQKNHE